MLIDQGPRFLVYQDPSQWTAFLGLKWSWRRPGEPADLRHGVHTRLGAYVRGWLATR